MQRQITAVIGIKVGLFIKWNNFRKCKQDRNWCVPRYCVALFFLEFIKVYTLFM